MGKITMEIITDSLASRISVVPVKKSTTARDYDEEKRVYREAFGGIFGFLWPSSQESQSQAGP
jgi:hypothetical protein